MVVAVERIGSGEWVMVVVIIVAAAVIAFRWSNRFALRTGTTPWRVPSALWAAAAALSPPIGLLVLGVAVFTTRPRTALAVGPPVVPVAPAPLPPAGWYPDPSDRFLTRYWDGGAWTDQVHDGVTVGSDPPPR